MKRTLVPIDGAGRIVLPKGVRRELAIKPGDTFKISIHGTMVTLSPNKESAGFVRKGKALVFSTTDDKTLDSDAVNELIEQGRKEHGDQVVEGLAGARRKR